MMSYDLFARAGGGGRSGSSSGGAACTIFAGLLYAIYRIRRARMIKQAKKQFAKANANDSSWDLAHFQETAADIFYNYQKAWMNKDLNSLEGQFHPNYLRKSKLTLNTKLKNKKNILKSINLNSVELMSVLDVKGQEGDMFVLELKFSLIDYTVDEKTGRFLDSPLTRKKNEKRSSWEHRAKTETDNVIEYWVFYRLQDKWVLYNIHQVKSLFGELKKASVKQLNAILREEREKPKDDPICDQFFYRKTK